MKRLFWVALGAAVGVYAVRRLSTAAQAYTPAGMASSLSNLGEGLKDLADAVREGMAEREEELRYALGIDAGGPPGRGLAGLDAESARALLDDPSGPRAP